MKKRKYIAWKRKTEEIKEIQEEYDRRIKVEKEAEELIAQCRFEEAGELLRTI